MFIDAMRNLAMNIDTVTMLVVDDHAIWRDSIKSMLEDTEFQVVGEAASGKEALETARCIHPELTLLDIRMAGGDRLETLVELKKEHPQMSVVMQSTLENPAFMARALARGAAGYVVKGIDRNTLLAILRVASQPKTRLS